MDRNLSKKELVITTSFSTASIEMEPVGEDLFILVKGGERPHIGCAVLAIPRPSLKGDGSVSCTSSVLNVTGHKDESICRFLAEKAAKQYNCTVVCSGGFHVDGMTPDQIHELMEKITMIEL